MSSTPFNADPDSGLSKSYQPYKKYHSRTKAFTIITFSLGVISGIIGGSLLGVYFHKAVSNCEAACEALDDSENNCENVPDSQCRGPGEIFWAGSFCLVIAVVLGIICLVFLIIYCTRRGRRNNPTVFYQSAPVVDHHYPHPYAQSYDPYAPRTTPQPPSYPAPPTQATSISRSSTPPNAHPEAQQGSQSHNFLPPAHNDCSYLLEPAQAQTNTQSRSQSKDGTHERFE